MRLREIVAVVVASALLLSSCTEVTATPATISRAS